MVEYTGVLGTRKGQEKTPGNGRLFLAPATDTFASALEQITPKWDYFDSLRTFKFFSSKFSFEIL